MALPIIFIATLWGRGRAKDPSGAVCKKHPLPAPSSLECSLPYSWSEGAAFSCLACLSAVCVPSAWGLLGMS